MRTTVTPQEIGGGLSFVVAVDGRTVAGITDLTPKTALDKFVELVRSREDEIGTLLEAVEERRNWNISNPGKGRNWPVFTQRDRLVGDLCKQAGIKDS